MKNMLYIICIGLMLSACTFTNSEQEISAKKPQLKLIAKKESKQLNPAELKSHLSNYKNLKSKVRKVKLEIKNKKDVTAEQKINLAQAYISETLVDSIFPYWLGTPWDFNGHTEHPRGGEIACGYFVTTTLRDVGFKINRYKIAQKAASDIIKSFCTSDSILRFTNFSALEKHLQQQKNPKDIFIVGLDYHVGFIIQKNGGYYFAHSNYFDDKVVIEPIDASKALKSTKAYVLGNLSANKEIIKKWLN